MKKNLFILPIFAALLAVACSPKSSGGNNPDPGPGPNDEEEELTVVEIKASDFGLENAATFSTFSYLDLTISADKGTSIDPKYYNNNESLRLYRGNTLSFSAAGNIVEIEFTFTNTDLELSPDVGDLDENKWTGENKNVCFTVIPDISGNVAISVFKISFYSEAGEEEEEDIKTTTFNFAGSETADFTSKTIGDVTLSAIKGDGVAAPKTYDSGDLRLYKDNVLTVSGTSISKIEFTISKDKAGTMEPNVGTLSGLIWLGESNSVDFTITDGQRRLQKIVVYHKGEAGEEEQVKTVLSVAQDVLEAVFYGETNYDQGIYYEDGVACIARLSNENTILAAAADGVNRVSRIEYLEFYEEYGIQEDTWEDGDPGAFAWFLDEDYDINGIVVEIGSYEDEGAIYVLYFVYVEEE